MFWNDGGRGVGSNLAKEASLTEALWTWSDEVRGVEGNFLGLVDEAERTVQFYFEAGIPEAVEDAERLRIVLMDFPRPEETRSRWPATSASASRLPPKGVPRPHGEQVGGCAEADHGGRRGKSPTEPNSATFAGSL